MMWVTIAALPLVLLLSRPAPAPRGEAGHAAVME
jgi:hypothetical protein